MKIAATILLVLVSIILLPFAGCSAILAGATVQVASKTGGAHHAAPRKASQPFRPATIPARQVPSPEPEQARCLQLTRQAAEQLHAYVEHGEQGTPPEAPPVPGC